MSSMRKPVASVRPLMVPATKLSPIPKPALSMVRFEPLMDLHGAASVLGMHWKTLESKARNKEVPAFKVGKRWRFRLSSLNEWLDKGIKSNTTDQAVVTGQERP
jgi:excisionase family DNA binding protein